ncbi:MAG: hypothetical protein ABI042_18340 [Verrucomicrobiota bacterium]
MNNIVDQGELFGLIWRPFQQKYRLRVNDIIRLGDRLARVVRINDCAAVVLINQPTREFVTRWDKHVCFDPPPRIVRISVNSETEILNGKVREPKKRKQKH